MLSLALASAGGCVEREGRQAFEGDPVPAYRAALMAVLDTVGVAAEDLVFLDRHVVFDELTRSEAGPSELFRTLADAHPRSRVCDYSECRAADGETQVAVSRVWSPAPGEAELVVVTYVYDAGGVFGDGFEVRLSYDGRSWIAQEVEQVWVPE